MFRLQEPLEERIMRWLDIAEPTEVLLLHPDDYISLMLTRKHKDLLEQLRSKYSYLEIKALSVRNYEPQGEEQDDAT